MVNTQGFGYVTIFIDQFWGPTELGPLPCPPFLCLDPVKDVFNNFLVARESVKLELEQQKMTGIYKQLR